MIPLSPELVRAVLDGDRAATQALVDALLPVVQARVAGALRRRRSSARQRDVRQEIDDMTQEVFAALFEARGRVLRAWAPSKGLSLANFVGLVAEREVASILRSGRRTPWREDPTEADALEALDQPANDSQAADERLGSREVLVKLLDRLRECSSPMGLQLFHLLFVEERSIEEVCASCGKTPEAVYAWKSRLGKLVAELGREILSETAGGPRLTQGER